MRSASVRYSGYSRGHGEPGHGDDRLRLQSDGHIIVHTGGVLLAGLSGIVLPQHDSLLRVSEPIADHRMTRLVQAEAHRRFGRLGMADCLEFRDSPVVGGTNQHHHRRPPSITSNMTANGTTSWLACSLHAGPYTPSSGRNSQSSYPSSRVQRRMATGGLPHCLKFSPFRQPAAQPSRRVNGSHCSAMSFGSYGNGCLVSLKVSTPLSAVICVRGSKVFFQPACFHREVGNHQYS